MGSKRIQARRDAYKKAWKIRKAITSWWDESCVFEKMLYLFNYKRFEKKMLKKYFFPDDAKAVKKFAR